MPGQRVSLRPQTMKTPPFVANNFRGYTPAVDIRPMVVLLMKHVPEKYLGGLAYIELTNSTSTRKLRRGKTRSRSRKVRMSRCLGFYCGNHIQILVDNLLDGLPAWAIRWPVARAMVVGMVLYHEIGHHIHATQIPVYKEPEDVADEWRDYLLRVFIHKEYWYLMPVRKPLAFLIKSYSAWRYPD
jgi:hypothetical protein